MLFLLIRVIIWTFFKLLALLYLPIYIYHSLRNRKFCPPIKNEILYTPAKILVRKIVNREISSEEVIRTYIERIKEVNPIINAVAEERFDLAINEAKSVDTFLKTTKKHVEEILIETPLLGVPISVKQSVAVAGMRHHSGSKLVDASPATNDGKAVALVKKAGAIILVTTNTPEYCLFWETFNNVTGTTNNPYDSRRTSGGSSGGEAALIASAGSIIGVGSDVGGSIRLPASFCGVFGHKPTPRRVSVDGHLPDCKNREKWTSIFTLGPITRYACDLPLLLRVISDDQLKLNRQVDIKQLKIYYMENDAGNHLSARIDNEIIGGMKRVLKYFTTHHNIIPEKVHFKHFRLSPSLSYLSMLNLDGVDNVFDDGKRNFCVEFMKSFVGLSDVTLPVMVYEIFVRVIGSITPNSILEKIKTRTQNLKIEIENKLGDDGVLIYPCFTSTAVFHKQIYSKSFDCTYLALFNSLGVPATSCPIGFSSHGLPISVQIIAKSDCDRLSLAIAEEIEKGFRGWQPPPSNITFN